MKFGGNKVFEATDSSAKIAHTLRLTHRDSAPAQALRAFGNVFNFLCGDMT